MIAKTSHLQAATSVLAPLSDRLSRAAESSAPGPQVNLPAPAQSSVSHTAAPSALRHTVKYGSK